MRAFIGVDVPAPDLPGIPTATAEAPSHLTVLFLGEVPDARVAELGGQFADALATEPPFELRLSGLGAFPSAERPRIVFVRMSAGGDELARIHERLLTVARAQRLPVDARPFAPHLTVLRVRSARHAEVARALLGSSDGTESEPVAVRELTLKSSVLTTHGPIHRVERRLPLGGVSLREVGDQSPP